MLIEIRDILLMDYISDLKTRLFTILSPDANCIFNKPSIDETKNDIMDRLRKLIRGGYIKVEKNDISSNISDLSDNDLLSLTLKGGKEWELFFKPVWSNYVSIDASYDQHDDTDIFIGSVDKSNLLEIRDKLDVVPIKLEIISVSPWCATYWKCFKEGYLLEAKFKGDIMRNMHDMIDFFEPWRVEWPSDLERL